MGLIAERWAAAETRNAQDFLTDDDYEAGARTPSGVKVNRFVALSLTTIYRCWDLLSSGVSMAPVDVIVKTGGKSFPEYSPASWLSRPNPADANYDGSDYFGQVALSLLSDGNYFTAVFPYVLDPQALILLNPQQVEPLPGYRYRVRDANGQELMVLDAYQMLHGWWLRMPGELRGVSPLEALRRGIGGAVAAEDHASRFFGQGASLSFGVEVPYSMDPAKKEALRQALRMKYAGARNSHAIGVLTDGAKFVSGLAPTPDQAQMLETRKFSVEDLCRPYGVPPQMVGSSEPGAASYASAAVWDLQFKQRAVQPLATRIERRHERLLLPPTSINDPNAKVQLRFNLDAIARADLLTRAQATGEFVTKGTMTPNEARALEDRSPLPGGDELYMQQQMVPLSLLGQTKATEPLDTQQQRSVEEAEERRHVEMMAIAAREPQISVPVTITNPAPIHVDGPQVTVQPAAPAQVHVDGAQVHVAPAAVMVEPAAVNVDVHVPAPRATSKTIERDAKGQITAIVEAPDGD